LNHLRRGGFSSLTARLLRTVHGRHASGVGGPVPVLVANIGFHNVKVKIVTRICREQLALI
jgi:hypothetical protein